MFIKFAEDTTLGKLANTLGQEQDPRWSWHDENKANANKINFNWDKGLGRENQKHIHKIGDTYLWQDWGIFVDDKLNMRQKVCQAGERNSMIQQQILSTRLQEVTVLLNPAFVRSHLEYTIFQVLSLGSIDGIWWHLVYSLVLVLA